MMVFHTNIFTPSHDTAILWDVVTPTWGELFDGLQEAQRRTGQPVNVDFKGVQRPLGVDDVRNLLKSGCVASNQLIY